MPAGLLGVIAGECHALGQAADMQDVRASLQRSAEQIGAAFFLFGMRSGKDIDPPVQIVLSSYPQEWQRRYDEMGAFAFDPVVARALSGCGPFRWEGLHRTQQQMALRRESIAIGMEFGVSCGDRLASGSLAILSFAGPAPIRAEPGEWEIAETALALLANSLHRAAARAVASRGQAREFAASLTGAELRCLQLKARGLVDKQVAHELGVAPRTVRYYLLCCTRKLGTRTPKDAVVKAVSLNLIDERDFPQIGFGTSAQVQRSE